MLKKSLTNKTTFEWKMYGPVMVYFQLLEYYIDSPRERHVRAEIMLPL